MLRRHLLGALALGWPVASLPQAGAACAAAAVDAWPAWRNFRDAMMSDDGRLIDRNADDSTTSEGQSYGLFFALVANDRHAFDLLLRWTEDNLCAGDLAARLPAWQWGKRDDGSWGVLDANAASDADLWIAYTLAEAGRLWKSRRYGALGELLARRIAAEEVADLPGLGPTLLPGPRGFRLSERATRLNPSYLPLPLLRWFAVHRAEPVWTGLHRASMRLLLESASEGLAPDWVVYDTQSGWTFAPLAAQERLGSYNAIRVYLWLGLTDPGDPALGPLLQRYAPMARLVELRDGVPEEVDPRLGVAEQTGANSQANRNDGPSGFQAALAPFMAALGSGAAAARLTERAAARPAQPLDYYSRALSLFALGFQERRYRFAADGSLTPSWIACDTSPGSSR